MKFTCSLLGFSITFFPGDESLKSIASAAEKEETEEVLEGDKRIVEAQQYR